MITKFGSQFAGYLDLENIGYDGTPVNDRWYPNEQLATVFDKAQAIAQLMDRVGYDIFWLAEHHFQREGYECIPNILMLSVHLAQVTRRLKFGSAFNISPMWHPLRLAEDFATADILTGGRVIFGVGRGYHTREVEVFGAPMLDVDANRELFEEQVEIILKAFNEPSFSHHGKHYNIPPKVPYRDYELEEITLVPRPLHLPVECWQPLVSLNQRGMDFMAKHRIKASTSAGAGGATDKAVVAWRDALARTGRETELGEDMLLGIYFHIAETPEKAMEEVRKIYEELMKMMVPLSPALGAGLSDQQIQALADPNAARSVSLPSIEDAVKAGSWLCGPAELITERLMEIQEKYPGLEYLNVGTVIGTTESMILEQLERFAEEVMPAFKGRVGAPALEDD